MSTDLFTNQKAHTFSYKRASLQGDTPRGKHTIQDNFLSFQQGNEAAFAHYFHMHHKAAYFFAMRLVKDKGLAEDIVSDSFMKLYEKRETIQTEQTIKGFLYTTVRNSCFDKMEQLKTRANHHKKIAYLQLDRDKIAANELIRTETISILLEAMEELSPAIKKVFRLLYIEGMSYSEIAKHLGRSKETIRKQKQQGILLLKQKLSSLSIFIFLTLISFFLVSSCHLNF